ncbi:SMI1/KNR4 family protein [Sphingobacterium sp. SRCM116780]|uniref:SMI1/KNR4 family protein n=1 Tax=Sphingobacterium sp. SRCM116780 TaxID=2907623 RepID=UPI001F28B6D7|nr:SMI1/KNR4 family protein [Sphingobacterium sp. SRCM116780]UIR56797.1 SMI1/KNR4 family protein [Sphingobacterium sp. SRCM116780]
MLKELELIDFIVQTGQEEKLNQTILDRYPNLPNDYLTFLADIKYCATQDEKSWFNTIGDFNDTTDSGFRWNEFEIMILDTYEDETEEDMETEETNKITAFWDKHIPFLMSCRNFYCYFAICLLADNYGQIVYGSEPEFEETEIVSNDFSDFMTKLTTKTLDKKYLEQIV